jgi:hypothetical protein
MKQSKIYISLPITGRDPEEVQRISDKLIDAVSKFGATPVSPLDIYAGKNPSYEDYICFDLRALLQCDAVVFAHDWQDSRGCRLERAAAEIYGKRALEATTTGIIYEVIKNHE